MYENILLVILFLVLLAARSSYRIGAVFVNKSLYNLPVTDLNPTTGLHNRTSRPGIISEVTSLKKLVIYEISYLS